MTLFFGKSAIHRYMRVQFVQQFNASFVKMIPTTPYPFTALLWIHIIELLVQSQFCKWRGFVNASNDETKDLQLLLKSGAYTEMGMKKKHIEQNIGQIQESHKKIIQLVTSMEEILNENVMNCSEVTENVLTKWFNQLDNICLHDPDYRCDKHEKALLRSLYEVKFLIDGLCHCSSFFV